MTVDISKYASMPLEQMKLELVKEPKMLRRAVYSWMELHRKDDAKALRPVLEALRGIKRDEEGRIVRSKQWKKERKAFLESKVEEYQTRIKNAKAELKALEA
jgi:hypothetical protein